MNIGQFQIKHGMFDTSTYHAWQTMKSRCDKPSCKSFKDYGGRGISYDPRWKTFDNFFADMGEKSPGTSLDRIDNDGNYNKQNCRWVTMAVQCNNRRSNRKFEIDGKTLTISQWAREYGMSRDKLWKRLRAGMSIVEALSAPTDLRYL